MTKKKNTCTIQLDMNKRRIHLPNELHLKACIRGGIIYRDSTKYTRKAKYEKELFD